MLPGSYASRLLRRLSALVPALTDRATVIAHQDHEARTTLEAVLNGSPLAIVTMNLDLRVLLWNDAAQRIFRWSRAEVLGRPYPLVPPELNAEFRSLFHRILLGDGVTGFETRRQRKDGTLVDVSISTAAVRGADGRVSGIVALMEDISARKHTEAALDEVRTCYRALFDSMQEGVALYRLLHDPAGRPVDYELLDVNPAFERMLGIAKAEAIGRRGAFLFGGTLAPCLDDCARITTTGVPLIFETTIARLKKSFHVSAYRIADQRFATVCTDTTGQRRLEQQFQQAQRMESVGRLAGGIAHDFNNLLTAIFGYSELVLEQLGASHPLTPDIQEIRRAGDSAAALTRQLLAFSRRQVLQPSLIDLNEVVKTNLTMLGRVIGEDVAIVTQLDGLGPQVKADRTQLEQVIMNLAVNARDAMPQGGTLTIETSHTTVDESLLHDCVTMRPGRYVVLSVTDSGCGMSAEVRERLFEPFFTTKEPGKGTGLGLATVYGIVKQSGGYVFVYSEPGRGSTFRIYLPEATNVAAAAARAPATHATSGGTEQILVVEDHAALRTLAARMLAGRGYHVVTANDGDEALQFASAREEPFDLLLTDLVLPGATGPDLAQQLRARWSTLPVLYMSGYPGDAAIRSGSLEHDVDFIQKPFTAAVLAQKVRAVLDRAAGLSETA